MASSFSDLGIELMATGENAGTWGAKTNTNLQIVEKAIAGYVEQAVTSGGTTALSITDGDATESTSVARHAVIKLTGTISGNSIVTVPDSIEKVYIVVNGTSGAYTVQFKTASGTGITFGTTDKGTRLLFSDGTNIVDTGFSTSVAADNITTGDAAVTIATSTGDITVDGPSDIILDADGGDIFFKDGGTTFGSATNTSGNLIIKSGTTTAVTFSGANATVAGNLSVGGDFDVTGNLDFSDANITNVGSIALDTITNDGTDITLDSSGDIILDADGADIFLKDSGTTYGSLTNSSGNLIVKSGTTTALTFSGADVTIAGDLTVSGDDITMGTNTAGNLLIADGTNFNSIAVGSLSEISTVANDDVFLAVDTSGGGLKKITRSTVVSGLASSGAISNVVEDTSPQLGGDLDTNDFNIAFDDAHGINDENGNEQIIFQTTSSAVNQFDITNAATGNPPKISATGGDSNIDLDLEAKGTGHVTIRGNSNSGAIQFNCEDNSHGQILKAQPHSAGVTNEMLLPDGSSSTLVSLVATQTLTNKTLTTPVIAEIDSGSTITLDATTDIILDADGADIIFKDGGTSIATFTNSSTDFIIESATSDKDIIFKVNDGGSSTEVARFDGDVSALLMASGKELQFADSGEKISGDGTDLTIASGAKINLTATSDVHIPNNVGIVFGGDSEKIEGDGTDLTISANNLTIDAAADIILDAAGNDFNFKAGGTEVLRISNSSSDVIIRPVVDAKDLIFQQRDGTEVARVEDNGTFNIVTDKLAINGTAVTSTAAELNKLDGAGTLKQAGKETIWIPAVAMYPNSTNGCADIAQTELSNGPELKTLDFDKDSDEFAQFAVAFPKSWNEGTITFQAFFTADSTNTGTAAWGLAGVALADDGSLNTAFGTTVVATAKAHSGTANDLDVTAESGAVTIAGSPSTDEYVFFQIQRDVSADDLSADAKLLGIKIFFTTDAANDA